MVLSKLKAFLLIACFLLALIFSRFYNLDKTARFLWDESSDLVNIHQIYVEKKLTLVGPISEDGSKVFGSLTYYMLLPFAFFGKFDPISTAYGAAFWGIITGILILYLVFKINKKVVWIAAPLIILWYPLVETGRWAWNPNLIPFWITLSLIFFLRRSSLSSFLSGLSIGLSIHHHYLAVFAAAGLGIAVLTESLKNKEINKFFSFAAGLTLAVIPFVIFDLRHPPGLFLSRILYFNNLTGGGNNVTENFIQVLNGTLQYFTQSIFLKFMLGFSLLALIIADFKEKSRSLVFIGVFFIQLVGLSFVSGFNTHYILPAVPFLIVYLARPRKDIGKIFSYAALAVLLISSTISFPKQITKVSWESDIASTRFIADTIRGEITNSNLLNSNVAVLGSPDPNTYGRKYRDLLLIDNVVLKTKGEYEISDSLFVITTSTQEAIRSDSAYEIRKFKDGPLQKEWSVPESSWKIFLLSRPI